MKIKINVKIIFIITLCVQLIIFISLITRNIFIKNDSIKNNRIYSFDCTYYDPYNVLKGRYVKLSNQQESVDISDLDLESRNEEDIYNLYPNQPVYLLLNKSDSEFWKICGIRQKKPKDGNFIKAKYKFHNNNTFYFDFLCSEYYMQENFAMFMDKQLASLKSLKLEVYCDKKGNILQKQLYVMEEGKTYIPAEEYVKGHI